ncbi:hypothetical protein Dsin_026474 [Dipteronia sinensis]|uniref:peptidylprolyl isomerase n=1 Tax=Dipteronia sinensis TaxID=43782 RepID=A0AAD9ZYS2_9ROSI|nr:hypothetical protein Dsin_026474 [Dipteronia sinensis]
MYIEEVEDRIQDLSCSNGSGSVVASDVKRVLLGAGARALFYPTLLYNVLRNKIQSEFRWWDRVDEFILLGAVPFPADVPRLRELGVSGVVTLNEPYETLVPTSLYHAHNIDHLVIPTRDYLFAPSFADICQAVDFIHENASLGKTTYVHCKAGRGRSTTIVLCYLVEHRQMAPDSAYEYVRSIRPRVLLASSQWQSSLEDSFSLKNLSGFQVKVVASDSYITRDSGLIFRDFEVGQGDCPKDGQQVTFHYIGYNESGRRIDSTYIQGSPAKIRMGTKALVPGGAVYIFQLETVRGVRCGTAWHSGMSKEDHSRLLF